MKAPKASPTREAYRDRMYQHLIAATHEPRPGQYFPFPGYGLFVFVNFAAVAVAYCDDEELEGLSQAVIAVAAKAGRRHADHEEAKTQQRPHVTGAPDDAATLERWFNLPDEGGAR